jgi:hypothetical protein
MASEISMHIEAIEALGVLTMRDHLATFVGSVKQVRRISITCFW